MKKRAVDILTLPRKRTLCSSVDAFVASVTSPNNGRGASITSLQTRGPEVCWSEILLAEVMAKEELTVMDTGVRTQH